MAKRVCFNCKWSMRHEDYIEGLYYEGRRVQWNCAHSDTPVMLNLVEHECNPNIKESDSFIYRFGCNFWEKKREDNNDQNLRRI